MTTEFDPGPPPHIARLLAQCPSYEPFRKSFWYDWGPTFYRGRLDGSAGLLVVASDPGPTECLAGRNLVGDAGQRVQGFLSKLRLTRSYVCLNALSYALFPSHWWAGKRVIEDPAHTAWRNRLFDAVAAHAQAVVAFGANARRAVNLWSRSDELPSFELPHPSSRDPQLLLDTWRDAVTQLRAIVTPDSDGDATVANYGAEFLESDYSAIPKRDLPFGLPPGFGDDAWGRQAEPRHNNSVRRDGFHTILCMVEDTSPPEIAGDPEPPQQEALHQPPPEDEYP